MASKKQYSWYFVQCMIFQERVEPPLLEIDGEDILKIHWGFGDRECGIGVNERLILARDGWAEALPFHPEFDLVRHAEQFEVFHSQRDVYQVVGKHLRVIKGELASEAVEEHHGKVYECLEQILLERASDWIFHGAMTVDSRLELQPCFDLLIDESATLASQLDLFEINYSDLDKIASECAAEILRSCLDGGATPP
jgi:hypothetical protein